MRKMNSTLHGLLDYGMAIGFFLAPRALKLKPRHSAVATFWGTLLGVASLTAKYPLSLNKSVPYPELGLLEILAAVSLIGTGLAPVKMQKRSRLFYLWSGLQMAALVLTTEYGDRSHKIQPLTAEPILIEDDLDLLNEQLREEEKAAQVN